MKYFILLISIFTCCCLHSQVGALQGKVIDPELGEGVPFATVSLRIDGHLVGSQTDFDGFYEIKNIPEGTYMVSCKYVGYLETQTEVSVDYDKITFLDFKMIKDTRPLKNINACMNIKLFQKNENVSYTPLYFELSDMTTGYTYTRQDMKIRR